VHAAHPEHPLVELDRRVEIGDRDPDVVDAQQTDRCDGAASESGEVAMAIVLPNDRSVPMSGSSQ